MASRYYCKKINRLCALTQNREVPKYTIGDETCTSQDPGSRIIGSALVETWQEMARGSGVPVVSLGLGCMGVGACRTNQRFANLAFCSKFKFKQKTDPKSCCRDTLKRLRPRHRPRHRHRHTASQTKQKVVSPPRRQTCR